MKKKKYIKNASGYSNPLPTAKPAQGTYPQSNPFMIPKEVGLNIISRMYPNYYYQTWDLQSWRQAADYVLKNGNTRQWAVLTTWCYQSSTFVQGIVEQLETMVDTAKFEIQNELGQRDDVWSAEISDKKFFKDIVKNICLSKFWGFVGLNFDIQSNTCFKYPMQQIDPINRFLKADTNIFFDGANFDEIDNLIFLQPSTSDEKFLGWIQPIARAFIKINEMQNSWLAAGKRLAYPIPIVKYPQNDISEDIINATPVPYNKSYQQAERILQELDVQKGVAIPYVLDHNGEKVSLEVEFAGGNKGGNGMQSIYKEFNNEEKKDILQMIFGETLTTETGKVGSQSLGTIHNDKRKEKEQAIINECIDLANVFVLTKIRKFYKNMPKNLKIGVNNTVKFSLEEIQVLSTILQQSGKKLTPHFFEENGISTDFFEESQSENINVEEKKEAKKNENRTSFFDRFLKKKS